MNRLTIIGNLTREPECRYVNTANGQRQVTSFSVAVNRRKPGDNGADFFRVTAWGNLADLAFKYLHKASKVCVIGPVKENQYVKSDGSAGFSLEVTAQEIEFLSTRSDASQDVQTSAPVPQEPQQQRMDEQSGFSVVDDDELPF